MSRSKWKGPFISPNITKTRDFLKKNYQNSNILSWSRNSIIPGFLLHKKIFVHNGKTFKSVLIHKDMLGCKLGEFVSTRMKGKFKKDQKKRKK